MGSEVRATGESRVGCLGPDPSRRRTMGFVPRLVSRLCFQIRQSRKLWEVKGVATRADKANESVFAVCIFF
ncbi:unnamed protein product [Musa acuminata var. zebrina]